MPSHRGQTLIFGGTIYSGDPANPHPEAVGIEGKKIVAVGSYQEVSTRLGSHAKRLDLQGKYLMPGLIDSHVHAAFAGFQGMTVNFPDAMNEVQQLQQFLTRSKDDPRLTLGDVQLYSNVSLDYWHQLPLLEQVFNSPQYQQIPVVLAGSDAHTGWANQAMLRKAGIDAEGPCRSLCPAERQFWPHPIRPAEWLCLGRRLGCHPQGACHPSATRRLPVPS